MSSWTGTKTGTTESPMAIHHLVTSGFTSKNIQTIDKMYHTITVDTQQPAKQNQHRISR